jgi:predicted acyl esterase
LSLWSAPARRLLELPVPRARSAVSHEWVSVADGTRLATCIVRPHGAAAARGTLLVRGADAVHGAHRALPWLAQQLAEQGLAVVLQECRGLHGSEGELEPFAHEAADGADTLAWLGDQSWFALPLTLAGFGYAGYAAHAALGASALPVASLLVGHSARDPYAWLHAGGALRLESLFGIAFGLASRARGAQPGADLDRALHHRPLTEADRVGARRLDWLRAWLAHPRRDAFWDALVAPLPAQVPRTLLLARADDASLAAMRADHAALAAAAPGAEVALEVDAPFESRRTRAGWQLVQTLRAAFRFLLADPESPRPGLRAYDPGAARWRALDPATQAGVTPTRLYLRAEGGLAAAAPEQGEVPDHYVYDPADATPCDASRDTRGDVLRYTGEPLAAPLELAGDVRAELFVASDAPATDFCVELLALDPKGRITRIAGGVTRAGWDEASAAETRRVEVDCGLACFTLAAGSQLRVEVASACLPRFDRHGNTGEEPALGTPESGVPARQTLFHDAARPSAIVFQGEKRAGPVHEAPGPP